MGYLVGQAVKMRLFFPDLKIEYVKIPKNACSTVINSLGWSVVQDRSPHQFDYLFRDGSERTDEWECIVVLRDPYDRLVSAYLNKLVVPSETEPFAGKVLNEVWRNQRGMERPSPAHSISFREFVQYCCARPDRLLDQHWKSQSSFLEGAEPTVVFEMDSLSEAWLEHPKTKHIELRNFAPHATKSDIKISKDISGFDGGEIAAFLRIANQFPPHHCFKNESLLQIVMKRYAEDYELLSKFGLSSI